MSQRAPKAFAISDAIMTIDSLRPREDDSIADAAPSVRKKDKIRRKKDTDIDKLISDFKTFKIYLNKEMKGIKREVSNLQSSQTKRRHSMPLTPSM